MTTLKDSLIPTGELEGSLIQTGAQDSGFSQRYGINGRYTVWVCISCYKLGIGVLAAGDSGKALPRDWTLKEDKGNGNPHLLCDTCSNPREDTEKDSLPKVYDLS